MFNIGDRAGVPRNDLVELLADLEERRTKFKFKAGQKWKNRMGTIVEIESISSTGMIFIKNFKIPCDADGKLFSLKNSFFDLIELVEDIQEPKPKFKAGQKWKIRMGTIVEIDRISSNGMIIIKNEHVPFEPDGKLWRFQDSAFDLMELVEDIQEPKPTFKVGQKWKSRNNHILKIIEINKEGAPRVSCENCNDTSIYFHESTGNFFYHKESHLDLIELVEDVEESKLPTFKVGQIWKTREGREVEIVSIKEDMVKVRHDIFFELFHDEKGRCVGDFKNRDLVELIKDDDSPTLKLKIGKSYKGSDHKNYLCIAKNCEGDSKCIELKEETNNLLVITYKENGIPYCSENPILVCEL